VGDARESEGKTNSQELLTRAEASRYTGIASLPVAVFPGGKMKMGIPRMFQFLFMLLIGAILAIPQGALAQDHVVTPSDLQKDVSAASATRQKNLAQVEDFLSSTQAQQAMKSVHANPQQVKNAVPQLSDDELSQLSARSEKAQKDFAAGNINDRDLLIILVGIVALILIIVAVR